MLRTPLKIDPLMMNVRNQNWILRPAAKVFRKLGMAFALLVLATPSHAAVSILLEQPYGDFGYMNPTGHAAVYFDHICADGPLRLRACLPGEMGVVISRYDGIGPYDWVAMPVLPYLYAVDRVEDVPQTIDKAGEDAMRDAYRRRYLEILAPDTPDGKAPSGNWFELAGAAFDRTIYGFRVETSAQQDADLISHFNDTANVHEYNGAFDNCADFVRLTINRFYPGAIHRNFVSDLGMTTPKSIARGLVRYAAKHPEAHLTVFTVPQVAGPLPRSRPVQGVAESLVKKYGVPLIILSPTTAAVTLVAYLGKGALVMPKDAPVLALHDGPVLPEYTSMPTGGGTPISSVIRGAPSAPRRNGIIGW